MSVQVSISGPMFAQLLHQHAISENNQEGLIIGEVCERRFNQINDQAAVNELNEVILKVCSFVPCTAYDLYNNNFDVTKKVHEIAVEANRGGLQLIGYYSFRRNLPLQATFRELNAVHALVQYVRGGPFVLGLFSTTFNENFSIHSMEHIFQTVRPSRDDGPKLGPASLRVVNLGEDARQEYRIMPGSAASLKHGSFAQLVKNVRYNGRDDKNVAVLNGLREGLQRKLNKLADDITETLQIKEFTLGSLQA